MPSARGILALVLLAGGVVLMVDAVRRGAASAALVLIFPVLSGNSPEFLLGLFAFLLGIVTGMIAFAGARGAAARGPPDGGEEGASTAGGVLLIGPIPIFFGSARPASLRALLGWVALGAALTAAAVLIVVYGLYGV